MADFSASQLSYHVNLDDEDATEELESLASDPLPDPQSSDLSHWLNYSSSPFASVPSNPFRNFYPHAPSDRRSSNSNWYSDSDSDSMSCFVTDLFENRSIDHSPHLIQGGSGVNPFSGVADECRGRMGLGLELGVRSENRDLVSEGGECSESQATHPCTDGLRVAGFGSDSDSNYEDEIDAGLDFSSVENGISSDIRLCWDALCLEDRSNNGDSFDWEDIEERVDGRENLSFVINEMEDLSVASGFSHEEDPGEEAMRHLDWEILIAFNNLERNTDLDSDVNGDSVLSVRDDYIYTAEYDALFGQFLETEAALKGSPPAAKSVVENLPVVELTEAELQKENVACAICKDEILLKEKVRMLPCVHYYHGDCILPWLSIRNTCPVCRFELPTDDPDYEQRKIGRAGHELLDSQVRYNFDPFT